MSAADTRANLIDPQLVAAGWDCAERAGLHPALGDRALSGLLAVPIALKGRDMSAMGEAHCLATQTNTQP